MIINCVVSYILFRLAFLFFVLDMYSNTKICSENTQLVQSLSCYYAFAYCNFIILLNSDSQFVILNYISIIILFIYCLFKSSFSYICTFYFHYIVLNTLLHIFLFYSFLLQQLYSFRSAFVE